MKKIILLTLLSLPISNAWSAASPTSPRTLDFVLGEKIATSLEKILTTYKPQRMHDTLVLKQIEPAIAAAKKGNVSMAQRRINVIIKEIDENSSDPSLRNMLNNAKNGHDPIPRMQS